MSQNSILKEKSFQFGIRIINLYKFLRQNHCELVISQQLLRCGTAIGASIREAEFGESRVDFKHKLSIGLKEANETVYWLELLFQTGYLTRKMFDSLYQDAVSILKMLVSSLKTLKRGQ
jgi:four helix bundle protein